MAKMYGQLPSYVKANATTYDMLVTDAVLSWEKEQYDKANGKAPVTQLTVDEMKAMINQVKNKPNKERT